MWIFQNDSQLSIVEDYTNIQNFMVRARIEGDIQRALPSVKDEDVKFGEGSDYAYRASVPREDVIAAIARSLDAIEYTNFKNSIAKTKLGNMRSAAYTRAWQAMFDLQQKLNPIKEMWANYR